MEQRALVERFGVEVLEHQRAGGKCRRQVDYAPASAPISCVRRRAPPRSTPGGFCRSPSGPIERHHPRRPVRPALDQRQRRGIGRPGEEIFARKTFRVVEREQKLKRTDRTYPYGLTGCLPGITTCFRGSVAGKARQHADGGGKRHRHQQADKTEQVTEGEQRKNDPDRMQADAFGRPASATARCLRETARRGRRTSTIRWKSSAARTAPPQRPRQGSGRSSSRHRARK